MNFDFDKFTKKMQSKFSNLSKEEIDELLNLDEDYNVDNPVSTGKRLILHNIRIIGEKNIDKDSIPFDFSMSLQSGVNMLIASNLKGKSSVFKTIKYALTGRDKLKPDIKKWIHLIFLNFSINEKKYTAFVDLSRRFMFGKLFNGFLNSEEEISEEELKGSNKKIFDVTGESSYQSEMNTFFFKQFTYYSLKWTQKSSKKDSDSLLEANASWITYFKSIFLESKDSGSIYGAQGRKIFQMLLGLQLTYPINRLTIKKDKLTYQKAKEKSLVETKRNKIKDDKNKLNKRLEEINAELEKLKPKTTNKVDLSSTYKEYNELLNLIKNENSKIQKNQKDKHDKSKEVDRIINKQNFNDSEISRLSKELEKATKKVNNFKEYLDIGHLFSNLDIKHCPSCNHSISESQKKVSLKEHKCTLCGDSVEEDTSSIDTDIFKDKIDNLEKIIKNTKFEITKLKKEKEELKIAYGKSYNELTAINQNEFDFKNTSFLSDKLHELEKKINSTKENVNIDTSDIKDKLISEKAVINYKLENLKDNIIDEKSNSIDEKIKFLTQAIDELSKERLMLGNSVIVRLSKLMKEEINALGLVSVTDVLITDNFDIKYKQNDEFITFDNITEGEQLRTKIAFYLSLIQLDIEFNFGRHTRLLIIDSPTKEEGDETYVEGFSQLMKSIEERFSQKLQILIGTAERDLTGIVQNEKLIPKGEYVF